MKSQPLTYRAGLLKPHLAGNRQIRISFSPIQRAFFIVPTNLKLTDLILWKLYKQNTKVINLEVD